MTSTEQLYADYRRTAPRLDLEFTVAHARTVPMPLSMLQAFQAEHAACVKDEPTGRHHSRHAKAVARLCLQYRAFRCAKLTPAIYHAATFTAEEYAAIACTDHPDRAYAAACVLSADLAEAEAERIVVAAATEAYADEYRRRYNSGKAAA